MVIAERSAAAALTAAGQALVVEAEAVLTALAHADAAVTRIRAVPQGPVRLALFPSLARVLLPGLLRCFDDTAIKLICHDIDMTPADVPALAADYDIVLTHRDEHTETVVDTTSGRWSVQPLLREPLDVALPAGHRLARHGELHLDQLTEDAWISVQLGWPVDDVLRSLAARTGSALRVVHRINDFAVTEELVAAGHGIALLPRYSTHHRGHLLVLRPLAEIHAGRQLEAVMRTSTAQLPSVTQVAQGSLTRCEPKPMRSPLITAITAAGGPETSRMRLPGTCSIAHELDGSAVGQPPGPGR